MWSENCALYRALYCDEVKILDNVFLEVVSRSGLLDVIFSPEVGLFLWLSELFVYLIEVRAMLMAVQQPSAKCTAIFTMFIAIHSAVTIHKTCTDQQWNGLQTVPASEIKGQSAGNTPNTLILAHRPRSYFL